MWWVQQQLSSFIKGPECTSGDLNDSLLTPAGEEGTERRYRFVLRGGVDCESEFCVNDKIWRMKNVHSPLQKEKNCL